MKKSLQPKRQVEKVNPKELRKQYLEHLETQLDSEGVTFFEPEHGLNIDSDYLILPAHITEVPSRELGEYLNAFTQQKLYLRTLLGRTEITLEQKKREYITSSDAHYKILANTKMSETAKERLITSQEDVKPLYYEYLNWSKRRELLLYSIANIEDSIFLLSREVSRRGSDFDDENRSHNVSRR